ncbi:hypothetical protein Ccrd_017706 [Cynara cardunculus var. scolymus]|uniref:Cation/H+ exchanger transmembrane domain-containing protein n=1 Tax=Cynara cardunculus var. scolymus TaxID=59895 RepID=A0A103Y7K0_CYNCS|nr:hypothetical protein Ccrd_017706 [Cynara cardunculus var. scolymus]
MTSDPEADFVHHIALFAALLCACIVIGHLLEESKWMNESITALAIGLGTGSIILLTSGGKSSHIMEFKQEFFFIYLLPPIIFNAGFQVKKKQFFQNFTTITSFGAIGTLISFAIISFALGAIFSATDSVCTLQVLNQEETPLLYSLVFGEGVVNDATSVVFGLLTKPIVKLLMPQSSSVDHSQPSSPTTSIMMPLLGHSIHVLETEIRDDDDDDDEENVPITTSLHILFNNPTNTIHHYWRKFDDAFMRPLFGGRGFISYVTGTRDVTLI